LPQLRQAVKQHAIITIVVLTFVLLLLFGLYTMGSTQGSGGISAG
jgi:hypothetical protein